MKLNSIIYNITEHKSKIEQVPKILSASEIMRSDQFIKIEDRENYKIQKVLTRLFLSQQLNIEPHKVLIKRTKEGKPYLENNDLYFNISHSGPYLFIASSDKQIGIDIETKKAKRNIFKLAPKVLTTSETIYFESLKASEQEAYFYEMWTKKEAYTKCIGRGLAMNFSKIELREITNIQIKSDKTQKYFWAIIELSK